MSEEVVIAGNHTLENGESVRRVSTFPNPLSFKQNTKTDIILVWNQEPGRSEQITGKTILANVIHEDIPQNVKELSIHIDRDCDDFYSLLTPTESPFSFDQPDEVTNSLQFCQRIICHKALESRLAKAKGLEIVTAKTPSNVVSEEERKESYKVSLIMKQMPNNLVRYDLSLFLTILALMLMSVASKFK